MRVLMNGSRRVGQRWLPTLLNSMKSSRAEHESNRYNHRALAARVDIRASLVLFKDREQSPSGMQRSRQNDTMPGSQWGADKYFVILSVSKLGSSFIPTSY